MSKRIGDFLIEKGLIAPAMIPEILRHSEKTGKRFGDAAVDLGLLSEGRMIEVFGPGHEFDFFHLESAYFPRSTKDAIPREVMLRLGALPLGVKTEHKLFRSRRLLNVGLINPARPGVVEELMKSVQGGGGSPATQKGIDGVQVFLVLADQYLDVVREVYGLAEEDLRRIDSAQIDETLAMFLDREGG